MADCLQPRRERQANIAPMAPVTKETTMPIGEILDYATLIDLYARRWRLSKLHDCFTGFTAAYLEPVREYPRYRCGLRISVRTSQSINRHRCQGQTNAGKHNQLQHQQSSYNMSVSEAGPVGQLPHTFGLWSGISVGWLTLNVFGGMSFILFVGLSAGGIPTILYGL